MKRLAVASDAPRPLSAVEVLWNHVRWVLVLAWLKQLHRARQPSDQEGGALGKRREGLGSLIEQLGGVALFRQVAALRVGEEAWNDHFTGAKKGKNEKERGTREKTGRPGRPKGPAGAGKRGADESLLNSVYQCRPYYGLAAPNNAAQRFAELAREFAELAREAASDSGPPKRRGRQNAEYDAYVEQWGKYAAALLEANGGWERFLSRSSLAEVIDFWPGCVKLPVRGALHGSDWASFVQRVLYLEEDRYVQVLATPAAVLWPVWFFKDRARQQQLYRLRAVEGGRFTIGPRLDEGRHEIYIDVSTSVHQMRGTPFPFGFAADVVAARHAERPEQDQVWSSGTVPWVMEALEAVFWSPPLLFAARGDVVPPPDEDERKNDAIGFIQISTPCPIFGSVYRRRGRAGRDKLKFRDETACYHYGSWAAPVVEKLKTPPDRARALTCRDMVEDFRQATGADVVLSYFPLNVPIHANAEEFERLGPEGLFERYRVADALELNYVLSGSVLTGGRFLSRQPRMQALLQYLGLHLAKAEALARYLLPAPTMLPRYYDELRASERAKWSEAVSQIKVRCEVTAGALKAVKEKVVPENFLQQTFTDVALEMIQAVLDGGSGAAPRDRLAKTECQVRDWGWASLMEFVAYTSVYLAAMLYSD